MLQDVFDGLEVLIDCSDRIGTSWVGDSSVGQSLCEWYPVIWRTRTTLTTRGTAAASCASTSVIPLVTVALAFMLGMD